MASLLFCSLTIFSAIVTETGLRISDGTIRLNRFERNCSESYHQSLKLGKRANKMLEQCILAVGQMANKGFCNKKLSIRNFGQTLDWTGKSKSRLSLPKFPGQ